MSDAVSADSPKPLTRGELLNRKTKIQRPRSVELPSGGVVLMRVPTGKDYREWKNFLYDEHGELIDARADVGDELLVAAILVNPDGTPMFTREDVINGAFDEIINCDSLRMKEEASRLFGKRADVRIVLDEDREKN